MKIPRITDDRVQEQALPNVRFNVDAGDFGQKNIQQYEKAATGLAATAEAIYLKQQKEADDTMLFEAQGRLAQVETDLASERMKYQGKAAIGYSSVEQGLYKQRLDEIKKGIQNDRVMQRFNAVEMSYNQRIQRQTNEYVSHQTQIYAKNAFESSINNESNAVMSRYFDNERISQGLQFIEAAVTNYWADKGDEGIIKAKIAERKGKLLSGVIYKKAEDNRDDAIAFLNENKESIDPQEYGKISENIYSIAKIKLKEDSIRNSYQIQKNFSDAQKVVDDDTLSYAGRVQSIEDMKRFGQITSEDASFLKKYLDSENKINAVTRDNVLTELALKIGDLNEGVGNKAKYKDAEGYVAGVHALRRQIMTAYSDGKLSRSDKDEMMSELSKRLSDDENKAMDVLKKGKFEMPFFSDERKYKDVHNSLMKTFGNNALKVNAAFKQYLYSVAEKGSSKMTSVERKELVDKAIDDTRSAFRNDAISRAEAVVSATPKKMRSFATAEEAEAANIPKGEEILIGGKRYRAK